jgi:hypothetical protein
MLYKATYYLANEAARERMAAAGRAEYWGGIHIRSGWSGSWRSAAASKTRFLRETGFLNWPQIFGREGPLLTVPLQRTPMRAYNGSERRPGGRRSAA